jgi:hypothetical protein
LRQQRFAPRRGQTFGVQIARMQSPKSHLLKLRRPKQSIVEIRNRLIAWRLRAPARFRLWKWVPVLRND